MNPEKVLREVAEMTMESLAYLLPMSEENVDLDGDMSVASVTFDGPFGGGLILRVSTEMLDELTSNMLGEMGIELTPAQRFDGFKEMLNVVCGNLLPKLAGAEAIFNVGAPQLLDANSNEGMPGLEKISEISIELDAGVAGLELYLDEHAQSALAVS